jgi:predicted dehydrogenase
MQRRPDVVLWGAGMVAGVHAAACQSLDWRVGAVASRSVARAADLAATVHAKPTTFDDLLARRQGDIAIVATPRQHTSTPPLRSSTSATTSSSKPHWRARSPKPTG